MDQPTPSPHLAQAWISVAAGGILLVFFPRILQYFLSPSSFTWTFVAEDGSPLPYTSSAFFVLDVGVLALAVSFVADGILLLVARTRTALTIGIAICGASAVLNAIVTLWIRPDLGLQLLPLLGAVFGVYMALVQVGTLRAMRA